MLAIFLRCCCSVLLVLLLCCASQHQHNIHERVHHRDSYSKTLKTSSLFGAHVQGYNEQFSDDFPKEFVHVFVGKRTSFEKIMWLCWCLSQNMQLGCIRARVESVTQCFLNKLVKVGLRL